MRTARRVTDISTLMAEQPAQTDPRAAIRTLTYADEGALVRGLVARDRARREPARRAIVATAAGLVEAVRQSAQPTVMEAFLAEYGLSTDEGVGLMCLAEALLRVPDAETIDELIADKIEPSNWGSHLGRSTSSLVNAATWGLMLTGRVLDDSPGPAALLRLGDPAAGRAGGPDRGRAGDEADGAAVRARRDHRRGDGAGARRWRARATPTPTTCSARRRAPTRTRCAMRRPMRGRSRRSGRGRPATWRRARGSR